MSIRILSDQSQILVVDIQQKLAPHLHNTEELLRRSVQVLTAAELFNIPISVAEQYPKGLGCSIDSIKPFIHEQVFEKTTFSCFGLTPLNTHLKKIASNGRGTLIVIGCEAHVCVLQTAIDALDQGYRVIIVDDAVSSRSLNDKELARSRLNNAGVEYVSTEMLLFEWVQGKDAQQFKAISALVK
jgi:nicotinamidase-related amidase